MSRGHDGTVTSINSHKPPPMMQGIVVGGVANGVLIQSMQVAADIVELGRPTHAKPLESKHQTDIEFAEETDIYNVNVMHFPGPEGLSVPFGLAILDGQTPAWAMTQLVKAFVIHATDELKQETLSP